MLDDKFSVKIMKRVPQVCTLTAAHSIEMHGNRLTELPAAFSQLANLRSLGLSRNSLTDATHVVDKLHTVSRLRALHLSYNRSSFTTSLWKSFEITDNPR